jgi:hypothetical protein
MRKSIIFLIVFPLFFTFSAPPLAVANEYLCSSSAFKIDNPSPYWSYSTSTDLRLLATWQISDPNNCITQIDNRGYGLDEATLTNIYPNKTLPTTWGIKRDREQVIITAIFDVPLDWLKAFPNSSSSIGLLQTLENLSITRQLSGKTNQFFGFIYGQLSLAQIWGIWFSKVQKLDNSKCDAPESENTNVYPKDEIVPKVSYKITNHGLNPSVQLNLSGTRNCIFLINTPTFDSKKYFTSFWDFGSNEYFSSITNSSEAIVRAGTNMKVSNNRGENSRVFGKLFGYVIIDKYEELVDTNSQVSQSQDLITIDSKLDLTTLKNRKGNVGLYVNYNYWYRGGFSSSPGGWTITWDSPTSYTARYSKSSVNFPGTMMAHNQFFVEIPMAALLSEKYVPTSGKNATKIITLNCTNGKLVKKISGKNPKCPTGFKKK